MDSLGVRQRDVIERTGWSKTTASLLYNCQQDYNPQLLLEAAAALNLEPYELLLPPDRANAIRQTTSTIRLAAERRLDFVLPPREFASTGTDN